MTVEPPRRAPASTTVRPRAHRSMTACSRGEMAQGMLWVTWPPSDDRSRCRLKVLLTRQIHYCCGPHSHRHYLLHETTGTPRTSWRVLQWLPQCHTYRPRAALGCCQGGLLSLRV